MQRAEKQYEHAIGISPSDKRAYLRLADLYRREKKLDLAVKILRDGLEKVGQSDIDLAYNLADLLLLQGNLDQADKTISGLEQTVARIAPLQPPPAKLALKRMADLLRGRWYVSKGRNLEAVKVLRRVAVGQQTAAREIARTFQAWQSLGGAYAALGQWDRAAAAYEQMTAIDPKVVAPHLWAAAAWLAAGRPDVAEPHCRQALLLQPSAETRLILARTLLDQQLRVPNASRNWDSFNKALAEVDRPGDEKPLSDAWRLRLLKADYLIALAGEPQRREKSIAEALAICRDAERAILTRLRCCRNWQPSTSASDNQPMQTAS